MAHLTFPPDPEILHAAYQHALSCWPEESCGVITPQGFVPYPNVSSGDRKLTFAIPAEVWVEHEILAVVHSHTNGNRHATRIDMEQQAVSGVPWMVIVNDEHTIQDVFWLGDEVPIPPLLGRTFRHGVTDCYGLIRDAYRLGRAALADEPNAERRIHNWPFEPTLLMQMPRDHEWWTDPNDLNPGANLYTANFEAAGFYALDSDDPPEVGDVFFSRFHPGARHNPKVNHAGLYIGNGLLLHHVEGALSCRSPLHIYQRTIAQWVRYRGPR